MPTIEQFRDRKPGEKIPAEEWNAVKRRAKRHISGMQGYVDEFTDVRSQTQIWKPPLFPCWTTVNVPAFSVFTLTSGEAYDDSWPHLNAVQWSSSTPRGAVLLTNGPNEGIEDTYMMARFLSLIEPTKLATGINCTINQRCGPVAGSWEISNAGEGVLTAVTPWDGTGLQWFLPFTGQMFMEGILDENLVFDGDADMSIWVDGSDTGNTQNVTTWLLESGMKLSTGFHVVAGFIDNQWRVINSRECAVAI